MESIKLVNGKRVLIALAVIPILSLSGIAHAEKISGRFTASYYQRNDDSANQKYTFTNERLRLKVSEISKERDMTFNFDGRMRQTGGKDYNSSTPDYRIQDANLEIGDFLFDKTDMVVGRQYVRHTFGSRVDGVQLKHRLGEKTGVGIFGGTQPDPVKDIMSGEFVTLGFFAYKRDKYYGFSGGYTTSMYKGKEDQSYLYGRGDYRPSQQTSLYGSLRSDRKKSGGYEMTNLMASVNYQLGRKGRVGAVYSQYRAVQLWESMDYSINRELQKTIRLSGSYRVRKNSTVSANFDQRTRERDNKTASTYRFGYRERNLMKMGYADFSYRILKHFTSSGTHYRGALGANLPRNFSGELSITKMENKAEGANYKLEQNMYAASLSWFSGKKFYITGQYEVSNEKYVDVNSIYTPTGSPGTEYKSSSLFLLGGYKF